MNILTAVKAVSLVADVAKTLELKRHVNSLMALVRSRKAKNPRAKAEFEIIEDELLILHETVDALLGQMKAMEEVRVRMEALDRWASLPWWKRAFSRPEQAVATSSSSADSLPVSSLPQRDPAPTSEA